MCQECNGGWWWAWDDEVGERGREKFGRLNCGLDREKFGGLGLGLYGLDCMDCMDCMDVWTRLRKP